MNLCDIDQIKALLARHGFRFSKSMGQNFLIQDWVPRDIAAASGAAPGVGVLEVGPGIGPLTRELAGLADRVVSVELDRALLPILAETLGDCPNAEVVSGDILKTDISALVGEKFQCVRAVSCANLPYNITTPAITALIEAGCFDSITVMIQREVAKRVCAAPGTADYGAFSVFCQYHTAPEYLFEVPPDCFLPVLPVQCRLRAFVRGAAGLLPARPQGDLGGGAHGPPPGAGRGGRPGPFLPGGEGLLRLAPQDAGQQPGRRSGDAQGGDRTSHPAMLSARRHPRGAAVYSPICPTVPRSAGSALTLLTISSFSISCLLQTPKK